MSDPSRAGADHGAGTAEPIAIGIAAAIDLLARAGAECAVLFGLPNVDAMLHDALVMTEDRGVSLTLRHGTDGREPLVVVGPRWR